MKRAGLWVLPALLWVACVSPEERQLRSLAAAEEALRSGQTDRAASLLESSLSFDPRDFETRRRLASLELGRRRPGEAHRVLRGLPGDVSPDDAFRRLEAEVLVAIRDWPRALALVSALDRRGEVDPELIDDLLVGVNAWNPEVGLPQPWEQRLFEIQMETRALIAALATAKRLEEPLLSRALDTWYREAIDCTCALEVDLPGLEEEPRSPWKLLIHHRRLVARGAGGQAAEVEHEFLARFPEHPERFRILISRARRENRLGHHEEGLAAALEAASLEPERVGPQVEKGLALVALGRRGEALRAFDLALAIEPSHRVAQRFLDRLTDTESSKPLTLRIEAADG